MQKKSLFMNVTSALHSQLTHAGYIHQSSTPLMKKRTHLIPLDSKIPFVLFV